MGFLGKGQPGCLLFLSVGGRSQEGIEANKICWGTALRAFSLLDTCTCLLQSILSITLWEGVWSSALMD